jgi:hypothetical protein
MKNKLFCALIGIGLGIGAFSAVAHTDNYCAVQYAKCNTQDNMPGVCEMDYLVCKGLA